MRGNRASVFVLAGMILAGPAVVTAQVGSDWPAAFFWASNPSNPLRPAAGGGDLLEFLDGSLLHGGLKRMDAGSGLCWESPEAKNSIDFQPGHIDSIRFAHAAAVPLSADLPIAAGQRRRSSRFRHLDG